MSLTDLFDVPQLVKPRHKRLFQFTIKKTAGKVKKFFHSLRAIAKFILTSWTGVDILNPIQVSTEDMETSRLKKPSVIPSFSGGGV